MTNGDVPVTQKTTHTCSTVNRDLTQQDGWKTQDGRMTYKNVAQDRECTVSRNIFSSFCRPESSAVLLCKVPNDTSDVNYGVIPSTVHFLYESIKTDSICVAHVTIDLSTKKEKGLQCHLFKTGNKDQTTLTELYLYGGS